MLQRLIINIELFIEAKTMKLQISKIQNHRNHQQAIYHFFQQALC